VLRFWRVLGECYKSVPFGFAQGAAVQGIA
jgi:hypothetical protein